MTPESEQPSAPDSPEPRQPMTDEQMKQKYRDLAFGLHLLETLTPEELSPTQPPAPPDAQGSFRVTTAEGRQAFIEGLNRTRAWWAEHTFQNAPPEGSDDAPTKRDDLRTDLGKNGSA